jgi:YHS domain-containing protein
MLNPDIKMKKTIAILLAVSALSLSAFAQKPGTPEPKELACAVMKDHKVNVKDATKNNMYADYKGRRYFFCCAGCKPAFSKTPQKFAKAPSIATPKKA